MEIQSNFKRQSSPTDKGGLGEGMVSDRSDFKPNKDLDDILRKSGDWLGLTDNTYPSKSEKDKGEDQKGK